MTRRRPSEGEKDLIQRGLVVLKEIYEHPESANVHSARGRILSRVLLVMNGQTVGDLYRLMVVASYQPTDADAILTALNSSTGLREFEQYLLDCDSDDLRATILKTFPTQESKQAALEYLTADEDGRIRFHHKGYLVTEEQLAYLNELLSSRDLQEVLEILYKQI
ncbi:hypothetical protein ACFL3C_01435 [Patescibacteria group bacterium]